MFDYAYDEAAIIRELGIEASSPEFQRQVLDRVGQLLDERVGIRVGMSLTADELTALDDIGDDRTRAQEFLQRRFPDYAGMYEEELRLIVGQLKSSLSQ